MSAQHVSDDQSVRTSAPVPSAASAIADPGPLGLAAFALTTFVLSFVNTGLFAAEPVVYGLAFAYGGVAQMLAGMWEFKKGNTFGATAFTSYGAFWLSFWYLTGHTDMSKVPVSAAGHGVGLYLLGWAIFTIYMFVASFRTNPKLMAVFGLLSITFVFLALSDLTSVAILGKIGGVFGILTALMAWFTSFTGVVASTRK